MLCCGEHFIPPHWLLQWWTLCSFHCSDECQVYLLKGNSAGIIWAEERMSRLADTKRTLCCTAALPFSSHIMLHISNIVTELASRAPPRPPSRFLFFLSSFFVFPLMEAAVLPCLHPEVRRIKLHLHFFLPCCGVVSLWSRCFESSGPVGEAGILKLRVDYLKLLGDDSGQHVLDYVPLFSWRDSNETWQRQQQCFLQQKEWWLAIHLWLGIFTCHMGSSAKRASHLHEGRKSAKNTQCTLKFIARKNALYVWGGNRMTARLKSASSVFWWNGAFAYQIVKQMQDFESEITKAKRL